MKVSVTDKELDLLKVIRETYSLTKNNRGGDTTETKTLTRLIEKCEAAKIREASKKKPSVLPVHEFLVMAKFVLGDRLKEQLNPTAAWYKQMQNRIDSRGINKAMANVALENCRDNWAGDIWIDVLINSLDRLCVVTPKNTKKTKLGWLNQIEEEYSCSDNTNQEAERDS